MEAKHNHTGCNNSVGKADARTPPAALGVLLKGNGKQKGEGVAKKNGPQQLRSQVGLTSGVHATQTVRTMHIVKTLGATCFRDCARVQCYIREQMQSDLGT